MSNEPNDGMEPIIDLIWTVNETDESYQPRNIMAKCDGGGLRGPVDTTCCTCSFSSELEE